MSAFVSAYRPTRLHRRTATRQISGLRTAAWKATSRIAVTAPNKELKKKQLGKDGPVVTNVCLGTMTWGVQNTEVDAHTQLDYAIKERGVNFLDTAEMYPVPGSAPGQVPGTTEKYIGTWLAKNPEWRERIVVATKVSGYSKRSAIAASRTVPPTLPYPDSRLDRANIRAACDASLRRLQTSYIDLYQTHWPDRYVPLFGTREYNPNLEREAVDMKETLSALKELIDEGKIRHWGVSNETTYGVCELMRLADELGVPRPVTIQNQFSLLIRGFEGELAEACAPSNGNLGLLPWSVLGGGALTGKYNYDEKGQIITKGIEKSRFVLFPAFQGRFLKGAAGSAIANYKALAEENGISLATMAQAWCASRWFIPSTIIGATTLGQLKENIDAFSVELSPDVLKKIDEIHQENKDPVAS